MMENERVKAIEKRLHEDAARLQAEVSPALRARVEAALNRTWPAGALRRPAGVGIGLWLGGSLTGLAAAASVLLLLNRGAREEPELPLHTPRPVSEYVQPFEWAVPLHAETAVLTEPLEDELANLRSDLEKARANVARDLDFTL